MIILLTILLTPAIVWGWVCSIAYLLTLKNDYYESKGID